MIIVGIDPGLDGAACALHQEGRVMLLDTPTLNLKTSEGKQKREYNLASMAAWLRSLRASGQPVAPVYCFIEAVHSMPGQGVRSMFSMGFGCGAWEGLLSALEVPYERVTPQRWKKALMDGMGKQKDASRAVAIRLFPTEAYLFGRKRDDGRADATLIAEYGRRIYRG